MKEAHSGDSHEPGWRVSSASGRVRKGPCEPRRGKGLRRGLCILGWRGPGGWVGNPTAGTIHGGKRAEARFQMAQGSSPTRGAERRGPREPRWRKRSSGGAFVFQRGWERAGPWSQEAAARRDPGPLSAGRLWCRRGHDWAGRIHRPVRPGPLMLPSDRTGGPYEVRTTVLIGDRSSRGLSNSVVR